MRSLDKKQNMISMDLISEGRGDSRQRTILQHPPVLQPPQLEFSNIRNSLLGDQHGSDGTRPVKALGVAPLGLGELGSPGRDVVAGGVPEDIVESVGLGDVLGCLADDDGQLGLVVC